MKASNTFGVHPAMKRIDFLAPSLIFEPSGRNGAGRASWGPIRHRLPQNTLVEAGDRKRAHWATATSPPLHCNAKPGCDRAIALKAHTTCTHTFLPPRGRRLGSTPAITWLCSQLAAWLAFMALPSW